MGASCSGGEKESMENNMENNNIKDIRKLKIILLGDSGVGKTSLINQYVNKKFQNRPNLDFEEVLTKQIDDKNALLQIRDTNGQERLGGGGLEASFFTDAKGCMLVYDVNDPKSFDNLDNWHNEFITRVISYQSDWKSFPFIVLGNKVDVDGGKNKEVQERARKWCESKGKIYHLLTSAKENKNVVEAFHYIAQLALNKEIMPNQSSVWKGDPKLLLEGNMKREQEQSKFYESLDAKNSRTLVPQSLVPQRDESQTSYPQNIYQNSLG